MRCCNKIPLLLVFHYFFFPLLYISRSAHMNHINSPTKWHTIYCKVTGLESCQISADSINAELQIFYGINIRIKTVHHKLHKVGFHARTAPVDACIFSIHVTPDCFSLLLWQSLKIHVSDSLQYIYFMEMCYQCVSCLPQSILLQSPKCLVNLLMQHSFWRASVLC